MNCTQSRPLIMGILNLTPDSFSDGGKYCNFLKAIDHAYKMVDEGADIIDVGGESTRPGAFPVDSEEELRRILPVVEKLTQEGFSVSVDTSSPKVMNVVLRLGVVLINDIRSFSVPGALDVVKEHQCSLCVMHMQGNPQNMQNCPIYENVMQEVISSLSSHVDRLMDAGILRNRLIVDPGFGFGKTVQHNFNILAHLDQISCLKLPILIGVSRKSMLCESAIDDLLTSHGLLSEDEKKSSVDLPGERLLSSVAAALIACQQGANIIRVHDVKETRSALKVLEAVKFSKIF